MKRNPLEILRKNLPRVLNGGIHMIVSVIEIPTGTRYKTPKRVIYHLYGGQRQLGAFQGFAPTINERVEIFNINKNKERDSRAKYEIIGDTQFDRTSSKYLGFSFNIENVLRSFNNKLIDTVVIANPDGSNVKILYDATGHLEVAQRFINNTNSWRRQRLAAELTGNPETLRQMGYFNPEESDDRQLIEKLRRESYEEPPQRLFDFGKKKKTARARQSTPRNYTPRQSIPRNYTPPVQIVPQSTPRNYIPWYVYEPPATGYPIPIGYPLSYIAEGQPGFGKRKIKRNR
jgi:hypothetical protein